MSLHGYNQPFIRPSFAMPVPSLRKQKSNPRYQMPLGSFWFAMKEAGFDKIIALVKKP